MFKTVAPPKTVDAALCQALNLALRATRLASFPRKSLLSQWVRILQLITPSSLSAKTLADARVLHNSLVTLNNALAHFTTSIPALVPPRLHQDQSGPFAYGAMTARLAFLGVAWTTCATYVVIIKLHRAAEALRSFNEDLNVNFGAASREKCVAAAIHIARMAQEVVEELGRPDSFPNPKEGLCVLGCVSLFHVVALSSCLPAIVHD